MRRRQRGWIGMALLSLAILAPPLIRWKLHALLDGERPVLEKAEELRAELATAQNELQRARLDLEVHGIAPPPERHAVRLADVLPLSDPSTRRNAFWVHARGREDVSARSVAFWASPGGGLLLVGRVARVHAGSSLVRVESLLDPAFRVRFQACGTSGILWGTGERKDGRVLLDVRHLSELVDVEEGEPVFTHGGDGRFPPGILIGWTARKEGPAGAARFEVHGAIDPERLSRILLAEDTVASKLTALILEENALEKRGRSTP